MHSNKTYHTECYQKNIQIKCDQCGDHISGTYNITNGKNYHENCYINNILEKCAICFKPVKNRYIKDFWGNIYHQSHSKNLSNCENCNRLICKELTLGGYKIDEKRNICNLCYPDIIKNKGKITSIDKIVRSSLEGIGIKSIPKNIPITTLNSMDELNKISTIRLGNIRGYTHYKVSKQNGKKLNEDFHIYILSNLHELTFKSILAHEYLHVYLFQNDYNLASDTREGFCNLGSQLILEKDGSPLADYLLESMYNSSDPDYGKGFIKMNKMLQKMGWSGLLSNLKNMEK